jgi:hypothetical protein
MDKGSQMKKFAVSAAAVLLVNIVSVEQGAVIGLGAQDRVAEVIRQVKDALGGDTLSAAKGLSAQGPFRRSMGQRDLEGTLSLLLVRPDKLRRSEEMGMGGMVGGPTMERITALNGSEAWDDIQNRGGVSGGMPMIMRGPPGGPGGAAGGPLSEEQIQEQRVRRMKAELLRWTVAFFAESPQPFTDGGVAESPDGRADILQTTDDLGRAVRLFVDQATHLPVMVQYQEVRPRIMIGGAGPGGRRGGAGSPGAESAGAGGAAAGSNRPTEEQMRERVEEMRRQGPPTPSQFAMHLSAYKKVNGIMLPHQVDISIDGEPNEEWTIDTFTVNPAFTPGDFQKPKG